MDCTDRLGRIAYLFPTSSRPRTQLPIHRRKHSCGTVVNHLSVPASTFRPMCLRPTEPSSMRSPLRVGLASSRRASRRSTAVGDRSPAKPDAERAREEGAKVATGAMSSAVLSRNTATPRRHPCGKATPGEIAAARNGAHAPGMLGTSRFADRLCPTSNSGRFSTASPTGKQGARSARNCAMKSDTDADAAERPAASAERQREREQTGRATQSRDIGPVRYRSASTSQTSLRAIPLYRAVNKWFQWNGRQWDEGTHACCL